MKNANMCLIVSAVFYKLFLRTISYKAAAEQQYNNSSLFIKANYTSLSIKN